MARQRQVVGRTTVALHTRAVVQRCHGVVRIGHTACGGGCRHRGHCVGTETAGRVNAAPAAGMGVDVHVNACEGNEKPNVHGPMLTYKETEGWR